MVSSFLAVLIFVKFADEFGASGNIETKELGKKKTNVTIMLLTVLLPVELKVLSAPHPLPGVVSVRFEEDEDRNLCLIAYPLKGDHGIVDIVDNSDCEPKSKLLRWTTNKKHHVLETEKTPKDWVRQHRKEEKMKR